MDDPASLITIIERSPFIAGWIVAGAIWWRWQKREDYFAREVAEALRRTTEVMAVVTEYLRSQRTGG